MKSHSNPLSDRVLPWACFDVITILDSSHHFLEIHLLYKYTVRLEWLSTLHQCVSQTNSAGFKPYFTRFVAVIDVNFYLSYYVVLNRFVLKLCSYSPILQQELKTLVFSPLGSMHSLVLHCPSDMILCLVYWYSDETSTKLLLRSLENVLRSSRLLTW